MQVFLLYEIERCELSSHVCCIRGGTENLPSFGTDHTKKLFKVSQLKTPFSKENEKKETFSKCSLFLY